MIVTRRQLVIGSLASLAPASAFCQDGRWPQRPIRIIVPTSAGGSPDIAARLVGEKIVARLGQSLVVENITTAGGVPGLQSVANGAADGYTLAMLTGGFATQAAVLKTLPYAPLQDFSFIASLVRYPMVYSVPTDSPIKSFRDLLERAKGSPNKMSCGIVGAGTVYHLLAKWIDNLAGVEINAVPYRGTAAALQDVLGGRVDVLSDAATSSLPRFRSGQMRALAVSSAERYSLLPGVPAMSEIVPGINVESWLGLASAANTPRGIVDRLNNEARRALELPEVIKWMDDSGVISAASTPASFRERVERDIAQWSGIVARNNIVLQ